MEKLEVTLLMLKVLSLFFRIRCLWKLYSPGAGFVNCSFFSPKKIPDFIEPDLKAESPPCTLA